LEAATTASAEKESKRDAKSQEGERVSGQLRLGTGDHVVHALTGIVNAGASMRFRIGSQFGDVLLQALDVLSKGFCCLGGRIIHKSSPVQEAKAQPMCQFDFPQR
jgi:hypothetical protein